MTDQQVIELRARVVEKEFQLVVKHKTDSSSVAEMISYVMRELKI